MLQAMQWPGAIVLVLLLGILDVSRATAQPAATPAAAADDAAKIQQAQDLYDKATELYRAKDYPSAVLYYERVLKLVDDADSVDIHYNIAKCFEKMAKYKQAIEHYRAYIDLHVQHRGEPPSDKADVEAIIRDLTRRGAPKKVKLSVETFPPNAKVYFGDRDHLAGQTPFEQELDPGKIQLIVSLDGYEDERETVILLRGEPRAFTFRMKRKANMGAVLIDTNVRGAQIFVQGQLKGLTPYPEEIVVPAGRRQIMLEKARYSGATRILDVRSGETAYLHEDLYLEDPPYSWRGYVGWTLVSVGALGIGGGVAIKMVGDGQFFQEEGIFKDLQMYQGLAYGLGGALMGIGTGLIVWEYARDAVEDDDILSPAERVPPPSAAPAPLSIGLTPGGLSVSSQFSF